MSACRNCGHALAEPRPNFCGHCGQETRVLPPTLGEFAQQFGGNYLAAEGALWRTLALLMLPGRLTQEYLAGRRRRYVLPLRLYLTISLVALIALRLVGTFEIETVKPENIALPRPGQLSFTLIEVGSLRAGMAADGFFCTGLPAALCKRLKDRIDLDPKAVARQLRELPERFISHWGTAMFLLLPIFAMWLKLSYLGRHRRYTEHLVFALHLHAFWFLMLLALATPWAWFNGLAFVAIPVYALIALQRVYGGPWWGTLLRAALQTLLYTLTLAVAVLVVGVWAVLS